MWTRPIPSQDSEVDVVVLPTISAENVQGEMMSYFDFDSPMGTNIYEPVGASASQSERVSEHETMFVRPT